MCQAIVNASVRPDISYLSPQDVRKWNAIDGAMPGSGLGKDPGACRVGGDPSLEPKLDSRRDLFEAMKQVSETGRGPEEQLPSMGCSIKWRDGR